MSQKFKIIFIFTLLLFAALIILNIISETSLQIDGWYSAALMYFFSFSFLQTKILEKSFTKNIVFVQSHLFLTGMKMFSSVMFIIIYGLVMGEKTDMFFFIWFFVLYLLYTFLLAWLFYKKQ